MKKIIFSAFVLLMFINVFANPILSESFETWPPSGWTLDPESGSGAWLQNDGSSYGPGSCYDGDNAAMFSNYDYSSSTEGSIITPSFDLSSMTSPCLTFYWWNGDDSSDPAQLIVYTTTNGTDWTEALQIDAYGTTDWTKATVDLSNDVTGVRFKGISDYGYKNTYLDAVVIDEAPTNPTFAISPDSKDFETVNVGATSDSQEFTITNTGGGSLTINSGGISITGTNPSDFALTDNNTYPISLGANQSTTVSVSFAPLSGGDKSANLTIVDNTTRATHDIALTGTGFQLPDGMVQIGSGTATSKHLPIEPYWGYTYSQSIYFASDFGNVGDDKRISKIYYNYHWTSNGNANANDWVIYMGATDAVNTDGGWYPIDQMTQVFDGSVGLDAVANGDGWLEITLDTPFIYNPADGANLIIAVDENTPSYTSGSDEFYCSENTRANISRYYYNDNTNLDPANPTEDGTVSEFYPNARFQFEDIPAVPVFTVNPTSLSFGSVNLGTFSEQTITLSNTGAGTITINEGDIAITGTNAQYFALGTGISYPIILNSGESSSLQVIFTPLVEGALSAVLQIQDNIGRRAINEIPLSGTGYNSYVTLPYSQDFETATPPDLPTDWSKINDTGNSYATVKTYTSGGHTAAKCAKLYNSSTSSGNLIMITPPYANTVDNTRVRFWAKTSSGTQHINVGTMSNPNDASTFTLAQSVEITSTYTEYTVNFSGSDEYIAFKHAMDGTYDSDYIDDIVWEEIPATPVISINPTSLSFGQVNIGTASAPQSITLSNTGLGTITINEGDIVITGTNAQYFALVAGINYPITLNAGDASNFQVIFTPLVEGALTAVLQIQDNLGSKAVNQVPLSGTGYVPPVGDTIENPFVVAFTNNQFTAIDSTNYMNDDYDLPGSDNNDAVYKFTLSTDMIVDVSLLGSEFDTKLAIYGDSTNVNGWVPGANNYLYYNDDYSGKSSQSVIQKEKKLGKDRVTQSAIMGMHLSAGTYFAIVDGYGTHNGVYHISINIQNDIQPPTLVAPADSTTGLALSTYLDWDAPASGATPDGYKVTINGVVVASNVTTTHYHPNLSFGMSYSWSVVSFINSAKGTRTTINSDPSPTWHFTTQNNPGNGGQGSQTGQGGNSGNNSAPAVADVPPMASGTGSYVDPDVTVDPDDPQTITVTVSVNNQNGDVPNPSGVGLSYNVNISGTVGSTIHITLSYDGMDPIPNEIIYFDGSAYQPVPNAVFGATSVTFPWTISGSKGDDTFVVNNGESSTLPVELSSFEATFTNENYVNLVWTTQSETDFMGFDVLRSLDENINNAIKVNPTLISGTNSSVENSYSFTDKEVEQNQTYYYWLRILNNNGSTEFTNPRTVSTFGNNDTPEIPKVTVLKNAYPNPFNPETHISFALSENSHVNLSIYNVLGQKVKTFYSQEMAPGNYSVTWTGLDDNNSRCSSGIYFYRLQTNNYKSIKKMLLLK